MAANAPRDSGCLLPDGGISVEPGFGAKSDFGMNPVTAGFLYGEARGIKADSDYADFAGEDAGGGSDDNKGVAVTTSVRVAF